jgi:hypothetical protein
MELDGQQGGEVLARDVDDGVGSGFGAQESNIVEQACVPAISEPGKREERYKEG